MKLLEREIIKEIRRFIDSEDVIVLHGARQVGKTSVMKFLQDELERQKHNTLFIDLEDLRFVKLLDAGPLALINYLTEKNLLKKAPLYLFLDEIQYLKNPSNFLKLMRDHYAGKIKLFVSGSSSFEIKSKFKETLVGRTLNFELYPLSFKEFLFFKKYQINLNKKSLSEITIEELKPLYKEYIFFGGYPRIVLESDIAKKEKYLQQIIDTYIRKDIRDLAGVKDILKFNKLLEVLAEQSGNLVNVLELANTARLSRQTVESYLFLMENTYVIKTLRPYSRNLRSELFKTPKIFMCDTGIAHLLWLKSFPKAILGNMFETSVFSELTKMKPGKEYFYWRTQDKKEIDFIVRHKGKVLPAEVKLSQKNLSLTALNYFRDKYKIEKGFCISLDIDKKRVGAVTYIYPWEIEPAMK